MQPPIEPPFIALDLVQGTAEWFVWRHGGLGASDAPALMGENPWRSPQSLFAEKTAPPRYPASRRKTLPAANDLFGNPPKLPRDNSLEAQARRLYIAAHGSAVAPNCLVATARPWQRASLDGIDLAAARALEIKCGPATWAEVARTGRVPAHYIGQLQHTLCVTGYASIDFWVWHPGHHPHLITEWRDETYITTLIDRQAVFWARVIAARHASDRQISSASRP